jgi:hypothetical protein
MPTLVTVFPALLKAQKRKKSVNFDKFYKNPRGGSGPKHSAFCGGCFSINRYNSLFGHFCQKRGRKITNRRLFPSAPKSSKFHFFHTIGNILIFRDPIDLQSHLFQSTAFYLITTHFHFLKRYFISPSATLNYKININIKFVIINFITKPFSLKYYF